MKKIQIYLCISILLNSCSKIDPVDPSIENEKECKEFLITNKLDTSSALWKIPISKTFEHHYLYSFNDVLVHFRGSGSLEAYNISSGSLLWSSYYAIRSGGSPDINKFKNFIILPKLGLSTYYELNINTGKVTDEDMNFNLDYLTIKDSIVYCTETTHSLPNYTLIKKKFLGEERNWKTVYSVKIPDNYSLRFKKIVVVQNKNKEKIIIVERLESHNDRIKKLIAIKEDTKQIEWESDTFSYGYSPEQSLFSIEDEVYFQIEGAIAKISIDDGKILWKASISHADLELPSYTNEFILLATSSRLACLDRLTGAIIWSNNLESSRVFDDYIIHDKFLFLSSGSSISKINVENGIIEKLVLSPSSNCQNFPNFNVFPSNSRMYINKSHNLLVAIDDSDIFAIKVP